MCVGKGRGREWGSPSISLITATDQHTKKQENRCSDKPGAGRNFPVGSCPSGRWGGAEQVVLCRDSSVTPRAVALQGWPCPHCDTLTHCRVARGGQGCWALPNGFGHSLGQGCPGRAGSVTCALWQTWVCIHRQSCSGSEMPAQIKREMSHLCQVTIRTLVVVFAFESPISPGLERVTKIIVQVSGTVRFWAGFSS